MSTVTLAMVACYRNDKLLKNACAVNQSIANASERMTNRAGASSRR
ncbi:MAG: hypothetical protein LBQ66_03500 [Planctomycetaceae bacterium]|nr:hypothetical protein [Planctomycetaceae bacterium]